MLFHVAMTLFSMFSAWALFLEIVLFGRGSLAQLTRAVALDTCPLPLGTQGPVFGAPAFTTLEAMATPPS